MYGAQTMTPRPKAISPPARGSNSSNTRIHDIPMAQRPSATSNSAVITIHSTPTSQTSERVRKRRVPLCEGDELFAERPGPVVGFEHEHRQVLGDVENDREIAALPLGFGFALEVPLAHSARLSE